VTSPTVPPPPPSHPPIPSPAGPVTTDAPLPSHVLDSVAAALEASVSPSTRAAYENAWDLFETWCRDHERTPFPASPETVAAYLVVGKTRAGRQPSTATLGVWKAAIAFPHTWHGHPNPVATDLVKRALHGVHRQRGTAQRTAAPITITQLRDAVEARQPLDDPFNARDVALLLLGFAGAFRCSELCALNWADLTPQEGKGVVVRIVQSKTDQLKRGARVQIPFGKTEITCPVRALQRWRQCVRTASPALLDRAAPVFLALTPKHELAVPPRRLRRQGVTRAVEHLARAIGVDPFDLDANAQGWSAHGLRAGAATTAAEQGAQVDQIMALGRWVNPTTALHYVRREWTFENAPGRLLGL